MHIILSGVSTLLIFLCIIIYPLRRIIQKQKLAGTHVISRMNRRLRNGHKSLGMLSIVIVYMHCRVAFHETGIRSGLGVFLLILQALLGLSFLFRKVLRQNWMRLHRILTIVLLAGMAYHIFLEFR